MPAELTRDGAVATITLESPDGLNILSIAMIDSIEAALAEVEDDAGVRCVVITGAGERAFCAGADVAHMRTASRAEAAVFAGRGHGLMDRVAAVRCPVIAAINGFALGGGCELALASDIRIAAERAQIGLPEVTLGIFPGWGGTQRLPRVVGLGHAMEMIASGRRLAARDAERIGLVNRVVKDKALMEDATALAREIASRGPLAVAAAKALVRTAGDRPLAEGLADEREGFADMFHTADRHEGMEAFFGKRPPEFTGT